MCTSQLIYFYLIVPGLVNVKTNGKHLDSQAVFFQVARSKSSHTVFYVISCHRKERDYTLKGNDLHNLASNP